jgi:hypothetical protein
MLTLKYRKMKNLLYVIFILTLMISFSEDSFGQRSKSSSSKTQTVKGYTKKDGTKVKAYERSPKGSKKKTSYIHKMNRADYFVCLNRKRSNF